jgi:hypothetical protein
VCGCLLAFKNILLSCYWKRQCIIFLLVWRVSPVVIWFVINEPFFFLFSLLPENYMLTIFVVCISTSILTLLIFFLSCHFCINFICFQFYYSISIYQILYSPIWSSFFWFLIFFLGFFIKVLLVFNFIIQFKLMVLCFLIWSLLFWFLIFFLDSFVKVIILFNFTLQLKIFFYVNFNPYFFYPLTKLIFSYNSWIVSVWKRIF